MSLVLPRSEVQLNFLANAGFIIDYDYAAVVSVFLMLDFYCKTPNALSALIARRPRPRHIICPYIRMDGLPCVVIFTCTPDGLGMESSFLQLPWRGGGIRMVHMNVPRPSMSFLQCQHKWAALNMDEFRSSGKFAVGFNTKCFGKRRWQSFGTGTGFCGVQCGMGLSSYGDKETCRIRKIQVFADDV